MTPEDALFTQRLASFVAESRAGDVPDAALTAGAVATVDTLAVAIAGSREPVGRVAIDWMEHLGTRPRASVWGTGLRGSAAEAAFVNGICSHALDFDDALPSMRGHASAVLVPTALAIGEEVGASGREVLTAFVLGVEVLGILGRAVLNQHYTHGWHTTSTLGVFGAAAVAGHLYGLTSTQLQQAWGVAASQASGLTRNFGTMAKSFHAGHAARCGIASTWLAREGMGAHSAIFEAERGFFDVYSAQTGAEPELLAGLGQRWEILGPGLSAKRWPCCYASHRAIAGMLELIRAADLSPSEIEKVEIGFLPGSDSALIHSDPRTGLEAKFSVEYPLAAMLLDGGLSVDSFTDEMVRRPEVRLLMSKINRCQIPDSKTYSGSGEVGYTDVRVLAAGREHFRRIDRVPGSSKWPLTGAELRAKVLDCTAGVIGERGESLFELGMRLQDAPDLGPLIAAASAGSRRED